MGLALDQRAEAEAHRPLEPGDVDLSLRSRLVTALAFSALASAVSLAADADPVALESGRTATHGTLGLTVTATEIDLPLGDWEVSAVAPAKVLEQILVVPPAASQLARTDRRVRSSEIAKRVETIRWRLDFLFPPLSDYANTHGGIGPSSLSEIDAQKYGFVIQNMDRSPWPDEPNVTAPFYFLIPRVPISANRGPRPRVPAQPAAAPATPLVVELYPYVDDGKHWVLLSDGRSERRPIDRDLIKQHNLTIAPLRSAAAEFASSAASVRHTVLALLRDPAAAAVTLTFTDRASGKRVDARWTFAGATTSPAVVGDWAEARARTWVALAMQGDSAVLRAWIARTRELYGGAAPSPPSLSMDPGAPREPARTTDVFDALGGRAALRETLQMELLRAGAPAARETPIIPVSTLKGVEVKGLPFDTMLAGNPGGRLPLADHVPDDRLLVYFAKPSALFPFLDHGSELLFRAGSLVSKNAVDDDLKGRYLRRLGLRGDLGRKILQSGEITELALVTPDLFFIDGTDVTVLMKVRSPDKAVIALKLLGIVDLKDDAVTEKAVADGRSVYWTRRGDLLYLSTSRRELGTVLAVNDRRGAGSLGQSLELRYLLKELPLSKNTRAFVYMSDPFIRRMVSPALKIGQLRRMRARADMEMITAGALLARVDGRRDKLDLDTLVRLGYVPRTLPATAYRLRDDLSVVSSAWGSAADLSPIETESVDRVTPSEARAYQSYVDEYNQYWRQYFDPIAMRLDDGPNGALELSTFILPLVGSSLYNQLREVIAPREGGAALRVPAVTPSPVLFLSLNLTEDSWVKVSGSLSELFAHYTGIDPAIFDRMGPGLHLAVLDADPIVTLGNADLMGAFGGAMAITGVPREALFFPVLASILTRPVKIFIELQDPRGAIDMMKRATMGAARMRRGMPGMMVELRQVEGRDAWIHSLNIPGIAKIRFGIEIKDGYLVLSNIPWSQLLAVSSVDTRALNGAAMELAPGAVKLGLPGLFATQSEQNQFAALRSMGALYPLLRSLAATPDDAAARHVALFGSRPLHPGPGTWVWKNGVLESSTYGDATHWKEPLYRPEMGDFGLFEGVSRLSVNMQFESGGLRALVRWMWKSP